MPRICPSFVCPALMLNMHFSNHLHEDDAGPTDSDRCLACHVSQDTNGSSTHAIQLCCGPSLWHSLLWHQHSHKCRLRFCRTCIAGSSCGMLHDRMCHGELADFQHPISECCCSSKVVLAVILAVQLLHSDGVAWVESAGTLSAKSQSNECRYCTFVGGACMGTELVQHHTSLEKLVEHMQMTCQSSVPALRLPCRLLVSNIAAAYVLIFEALRCRS